MKLILELEPFPCLSRSDLLLFGFALSQTLDERSSSLLAFITERGFKVHPLTDAGPP